MGGPNLPFGGLACGLVLGPLPSMLISNSLCIRSANCLPKRLLASPNIISSTYA